MSSKTSAQSGMLNTYLHEKHVPFDQHVTVSTKGSLDHGAARGGTCPMVAATHEDDQAVNDLDKYMRQKTDPHLLRVARKEQKHLDEGRSTL